MNKTAVIAIVLALVGTGLFFIGNRPSKDGLAISNMDEITLYKEGSCGCCGIYTNYLDKKVEGKIKVVDMPEVNSIKKKYNIPLRLQSCHTTVMGDYFVEGHIPVEAMDKLMREKPDIAGIAMPGMPSGSPGMPGGKIGPFVIYGVNKDGSYNEFMRI